MCVYVCVHSSSEQQLGTVDTAHYTQQCEAWGFTLRGLLLLSYVQDHHHKNHSNNRIICHTHKHTHVHVNEIFNHLPTHYSK